MLERTLGRFGLKKEASKWKVMEAWPWIVGESIAKIARPVKIIQGALYVGTSSSSWAAELDLRKREILSLIQQHLGDIGVRDIRFQSTAWTPIEREKGTPKPPELNAAQMKKIHELSEKIENPAVRRAFEKVLIRDAQRKGEGT